MVKPQDKHLNTTFRFWMFTKSVVNADEKASFPRGGAEHSDPFREIFSLLKHESIGMLNMVNHEDTQTGTRVRSLSAHTSVRQRHLANESLFPLKCWVKTHQGCNTQRNNFLLSIVLKKRLWPHNKFTPGHILLFASITELIRLIMFTGNGS